MGKAMTYTGIVLGGPKSGEVIESERKELVMAHQLPDEEAPEGRVAFEEVYYDYIERHGQGFWMRQT